MSHFDFVTLVIGLLIGMIIMLLIVWSTYITRTFMFSYCAQQPRYCAGNDYYNDPGDALANDPNIKPEDILFLNNENEMFYKRVPRTTNCIIEGNQVVHMKYPQFCAFKGETSEGTWKQSAFNSNLYEAVGFLAPNVKTKGNCIPDDGESVDHGVPLLYWEPNPIS